MLTNNKNVLTWVDEMIALTKPDKVVWVDGSDEQLAQFIQSGDSDELIPVLWEKIKPLVYMKCEKIYAAKPNYFKQCGVEVWDMKQACYSAYLAAIKYYKPAIALCYDRSATTI